MHYLLEVMLVPVCSPALLEDAGANAPLDEPLDEPLRLHRRQNPDAWRLYAQASGIVLNHSAIGARHALHSMLIEAGSPAWAWH